MEYTIRGLRVRFPYKAYECQLMFMERVIQALQEGTNALLESPTGTGKTLCLLCATLAWREAEQARILQLDEGSSTRAPRVFYLSRTHSQLTKVISELRGSGYAPTSALLGARSQLCVNPAVKSQRGSRLNTACHSLVARRGCTYYEGVAAKKDDPAITNAIFDIEELRYLVRLALSLRDTLSQLLALAFFFPPHIFARCMSIVSAFVLT
jgi:regulator of telomere elongation helicase 1